MRKTVFANGEYYHIYNRGVDKRDVFLDEQGYNRFLICLREFNRIDPIGSLYEKETREKIKMANGGSTSIKEVEPLGELVEIVCYCLNPNHYHIILKQKEDRGVEKFMQRVGTGYTMYFNGKYKRSGALFQGRFKSIHVESNDYLLYLSAYVNRNHFIHGYKDTLVEVQPPLGRLNLSAKDSVKSSSEWKYCSALDYLGKRGGTLCNKDVILGQFAVGDDEVSAAVGGYAEFLEANAAHLKEKKELEKYWLE